MFRNWVLQATLGEHVMREEIPDLERMVTIGERTSEIADGGSKAGKSGDRKLGRRHVRDRVRSFWSRSLRSGTLRSRSFGSEAKFGHFGRGHLNKPRQGQA